MICFRAAGVRVRKTPRIVQSRSLRLAVGAASFALLGFVTPAAADTQGQMQGAAISLIAPPLIEGQVLATFVYVADRALPSVCVGGTFNAWSKNANPMRVDADGRTWRLTLPLSLGRYQYKFFVDGSTWVIDPNAKRVDDGGGNKNSLLTLLPADYALPARPDDGVIAASALLHDAASASCRNYDRGALTLALRARPNDLRAVTLILNGKRIAMQAWPVVGSSDADSGIYTRWLARVPWDRKADLRYTFELADGARIAVYGADGLAETPGTPTVPFVLRVRTFHSFAVPSWVEKSVLYQIFPDRFANGDRRNDPPEVVAWDAKPTGGNHFGGDAAGVKAHLDYLSGLGVGAVYFNPVFESPSNHRYDTTDYKKIEPQFGTNAEFADLTRAMKRRGIRTVMDFPFAHTGSNFKVFVDVREKGPASPYKDWYFIHSYPVRVQEQPNYDVWRGFPWLPTLNLLNPATRDYLLGVADYWEATAPLAGMRLEAAHAVDPRFWRALRAHVKAAHPDTWIVGEARGDASLRLGGDQWDSVTDYPFRDACVAFFADGRIKPSEFALRLMSIYNGYAPQVSRNLMNMLSSHDTPRFLTLCKGDANLDKLAAAVQFTWVGTPSIYYGEELGMEGGADPDNRRGMRWDLATRDNPMLSYYKRLVATRNAHPVLQSGDPQILMTDDAADTLAYARILGADAALVVLNRSGESRNVAVPLPAALQRATHGRALIDALSGQAYSIAPGQTRLTLPLAPYSALILLLASGTANLRP